MIVGPFRVSGWRNTWNRVPVNTLEILCGFLIIASVAAGAAPAADPLRECAAPAPLAADSLLLDGVSLGGRLLVVGDRGHVLFSDDQGRSWRQAAVPTQVMLTAVYFHDQRLGWAVGHDAVILRTRDGGETWKRVYCAPEKESPLLDILFFDAQNGIAVGAYGLYLVTADGGDTWEQQWVSEDDFHLNHVTRADSETLFIAAEAGTIYRSDDRGKTWDTLPSPYRGSLFGILPLSRESLLVFGLRGHLYRSDDGGVSWTEIKTPTKAMLTHGSVLPDGTIVISGLSGTLLVSKDHGRIFRLVQQPDRKGIAALVAASNGSLMAVGENGVRKISLSY